jgi:hypothetical protein
MLALSPFIQGAIEEKTTTEQAESNMEIWSRFGFSSERTMFMKQHAG